MNQVVFDKPTRACSLLTPKDKRDDCTIYDKIKKLYKDIPGSRIATLKKDGIRAVVLGDLASRTIKKIPNLQLQSRRLDKPYGLDVELYADELDFDEITSIVMDAKEQADAIKFHIIDLWDKGQGIPYTERLALARFLCHHCSDVVPADPVECPTPDSLFQLFLDVERSGGEGICWRLPASPYFQKGTVDNRSTLNEQLLIKLARPIRSECIVIGFEEQMLNINPDKRNALGAMNRSSSAAGKIGKGVLGKFLVRDADGLEFKVGTGIGLTGRRRAEIWLNQDKYLGKTIMIESKSHGVKVKPRSPVYVGVRDSIDL
jgi:hypothetical protein